MEQKNTLGLEATWNNILNKLQKLVTVYERANNIMSLYTLSYIRRQVCKHIINRKPRYILDAGSGPGVMTKYLMDHGCNAYFIEMDPLVEMLYTSKRSMNSNSDHVRGVFEYLPFRESSFNLIISGFAFRDAINMVKGTVEFYRVLSSGGNIVILDLGKPLKRRFLSIVLEKVYIRILPVIVGLLLLGSHGRDAYKGLYETYKKYPFTPYLLLLFKKKFGEAKAYYMLSGAVMMLVAGKN